MVDYFPPTPYILVSREGAAEHYNERLAGVLLRIDPAS
jgi:hypothetical protein